MMPFFTVVIPAYNRAHLLPECLDSLTAQTLADWECVVVDDGSQDETPALMAEYSRRDPRFRTHRQPNAGAAASRNAGIQRAAGEWIAFLDSDDYYFPDTLAAFRKAAESAPIAAGFLTSTPVPTGGLDGRVTVADAFLPNLGFTGARPPLSMSSAAMRRSSLEEVGGFLSEAGGDRYPGAEDWEFWVRATARFPVATVHSLVAHYRVEHGEGKHDGFVGSGRILAAVQRIFADVRESPVVRERLRTDPDREKFERLLAAHTRMLASVEQVRAGKTPAAAAELQQAAAGCETDEELASLVRMLKSYLYFPRSRPREAVERCAGWLAALAAALPAPADPRLRDLLTALASDAYFLAAADLRQDGRRAEAWRTALAGLRRTGSVRSLKSAVRFALAGEARA